MANANDKPETFNRSSALTPLQMATATDADTKAAVATTIASNPQKVGDQSDVVQAAVKASVEAVFASLAPMLEKLALTPEKMRELKAPYVDTKVLDRERREGQQSREQDEEARKNTALKRATCPHAYVNGTTAINLSHNFFDRQPRGICVLCNDVIHPMEWRLASPDPTTGSRRTGLIDRKVTPEALLINPMNEQPAEYVKGCYLVKAHKDYSRVMLQERSQGQSS